MRKIAIVAFSQASRGDAPFDDPSYEIWGMNNLHVVLPDKRFTRWYELHPLDFILANNKNLWTDHRDWLTKANVPVYMRDAYEQFPTSLRYPIEDVQEMMRSQLGFESGEDKYIHSTPAFALAHAVLEGADLIEIYGCDMVVDDEWGFQRANMEAWITLARQQAALSGNGKLRVKVAEKCALMKGQGLYAYDDTAYAFILRLEESLRSLRAQGDEQKKKSDQERAAKQIEMNTNDGAVQAVGMVLDLLKQMKRGYQI